MKVINKDGINENTDRKRKKNDSTPKLSKDEVYNNVINFEENESKNRSVEKDSNLFHQSCEELRKIFDDVAALKRKSSEQAKHEITGKKVEGSLLFVLLKKLNRLDKVRFRDSREALQKEKLRVDSNRLQLQNLLYEADHLNKEIQRCYQFKSQDEEINLVSVEDFYDQAPEKICRPEKTKSDEHARRLARLEWELQQRKELANLYDELQTEKGKIAEEINKKTERIESLAPRLQSLLKATRPLQEALELHIEKEWEVQKISKLLSRPLYLLYSNVFAYISAINTKFIKVTIDGDEDEAKQVENYDNDVLEEANSQDSDIDENDIDYDNVSKGYHRRLSKIAMMEQKIQNLYKAHPLTVTVSIINKNNSENYFDIKFTYLPKLGFVTVQCVLVGQTISGVSGDILRPDAILNSLMGNDNGTESPNPKTKYQLCDLKIEHDKFYSTLNEKNYGKPYIWAQNMCGIDFLNAFTDPNLHKDLSVNTVPEIIKLFRLRWESRVILQQQIKIFEDNQEHFMSILKSYSVRLSSRLTQCTSISWSEYLNKNVTQKFIEENNVSENDLFYKVLLTRGVAKLECLISIPCNFPTSLALWNLHLNWNGSYNSGNNAAIRDMEYWINSAIKDIKSSNQILEKQMERALYCLDIYLETEGTLFNPTEFIQEKTFLKAFRGRQRSRPYKLIDNEGCSVFTQI